ncbi:MAG: sugar phosphate isomerase/epimerase [Candidatus Omnitrophica bacterium]|nr:sugar phosphate isomerase/epimerase [Candidatus Omnitrophota bacterium]
MLSLSASWNSASHSNGYGLIDEIKAAGFDTVELNFALTERMIDDVLAINKIGAIKVSSLHNICPLPKEAGVNEASPDYYSLASPDTEERRLAVAVTKNTIDWAAKFAARAVVLHAGRVQIKDGTRDLALLTGDHRRFDDFKSYMIKDRERKKGVYLGNVIKSLGELIPYAKNRGISLGIENRYYYREIPIFEEFEEIFSHFKYWDLYYWHDVGHAEVFERLGFCRHKDLLERFADRLLGIHLHDIIGVMDDHKVPGLGTFDFSMLKSYLRKETIRVMEVHQPASIDEVRRGAEYLYRILG